MTSHRRPTWLLAAAIALASTSVTAVCSGDDGPDDADDADDKGSSDQEATVTTPPRPELSERADPLPVVTPTPRDARWLGPDVAVSPVVTIVVAADADPAAIGVVTQVLEVAGATDIAVTEAAGTDDQGGSGGDRDPGGSGPGGSGGDRASGDRGEERETGEAGDGAGAVGLTVRVGTVDDGDVVSALDAAGVAVPADLPAEGYALAAYGRSDGSATVVLAGADAAGTFYAAQTLRQLTGDGAVAGVGIVDFPAMQHRGAIEGFYGSPWTTDERLDQFAFYGQFKLNTYIYAPKYDPYHRDQWREAYPADLLDDLRTLVDAAAENHVAFTFAVSPGVSICYGDPADLEALTAKLETVYALGVRSFSIALDDIDHTRWNCDGDADRYGAPSTAAAARAHADLLNAVQSGFIAGHVDARSLQMVPTEYGGTTDSPYRTVMREQLDPQVEVMWTGLYVVPAGITVAQADAAAATFGRPLYVWDNTPVNDFPATEGRLILAPYAGREPGLSAHVTGIVLNPMNQAAASKVQLVGGADFSWNDSAYDPARAQRAAADHIAAGDPRTVEALLVFFDLENLAPTSASSGRVAQPQAPALAGHLDAFRSAWEGGDRDGAIAGLRPYAEQIAAAPDLIRGRVDDAGFLSDCDPWLDATALWGQALVASLDALAADLGGDTAAADASRATVDALVAQAGAIRTIPGETMPEGPVRVGDGVLDDFIADALGQVRAGGR